MGKIQRRRCWDRRFWDKRFEKSKEGTTRQGFSLESLENILVRLWQRALGGVDGGTGILGVL